MDSTQILASSQLDRPLLGPLPLMPLSGRAFLLRACRHGYLIRWILIGIAALKDQSKHRDREIRDSEWVDADCGCWVNSEETPEVILIRNGINVPMRCCFEWADLLRSLRPTGCAAFLPVTARLKLGMRR